MNHMIHMSGTREIREIKIKSCGILFQSRKICVDPVNIRQRVINILVCATFRNKNIKIESNLGERSELRPCSKQIGVDADENGAPKGLKTESSRRFRLWFRGFSDFGVEGEKLSNGALANG